MDITEEVGQYYKFNKKSMNWHNLKTYGAWALVFVWAGLNGIHDAGFPAQWVDIAIGVVAVLMNFEHTFFGNTDTPSTN